MIVQKQGLSRRTLLGAAGGAAFGTLPGLIRPAAAADEFKIGLFIALSGPASLFGPTQKASAELATDEINKAGGILGRQIKLIPTDAGGPPAESTKSAVRLMLEEKVCWLARTTAPRARRWSPRSRARCLTSTRRSTKAASAPSTPT